MKKPYSFDIADGGYAIACGNQQIASAFSRDTAEKITNALNATNDEPTDPPKKFVVINRVKEWRVRRDLTQAQLADLIGVNQATVGKYEQNKIGLDLDILERLANALQVAPSLLISNHGAEE